MWIICRFFLEPFPKGCLPAPPTPPLLADYLGQGTRPASSLQSRHPPSSSPSTRCPASLKPEEGGPPLSGRPSDHTHAPLSYSPQSGVPCEAMLRPTSGLTGSLHSLPALLTEVSRCCLHARKELVGFEVLKWVALSLLLVQVPVLHDSRWPVEEAPFPLLNPSSCTGSLVRMMVGLLQDTNLRPPRQPPSSLPPTRGPASLSTVEGGPLRDCRVLLLNPLTSLHQLVSLHRQLLAQDFCLAPHFPALFHQVYSVLGLKEQVDQCKYLCSEASLALLPPFPWPGLNLHTRLQRPCSASAQACFSCSLLPPEILPHF